MNLETRYRIHLDCSKIDSDSIDDQPARLDIPLQLLLGRNPAALTAQNREGARP